VPATPAAEAAVPAVLRVHVTAQGYDYFRPWRKRPIASRVGLGALVAPNRVLVTATLVEDAAYVMLERVATGDQAPAKVEVVDYMANLAVVSCEKAEFLADLAPLALDQGAKLGDALAAWQFEENGTPYQTAGVLRSFDIASYPFEGRGMLVYRAECNLASLTSPFGIPVLREGRLAGLLMQFNSDTRSMTLIPAPVMQHFLQDVLQAPYEGFPQVGLGFAFMDDAQFRSYVGVEGVGGVYVTTVRPGGAAALAGLRAGDVVLAIGPYVIDRRGEYFDPEFGRIALSHLISTRCFAGDKLVFRVIRDSAPLELELTLAALRAEEYPIPPYLRDQAPNYLVEGGLVFVELTRDYLTAWGPKWTAQAPQRLVYYESRQWELLQPGQRLVVLSHVLPTRGNVGYGELNHEVVTQVNGQPITSLAALQQALNQPREGFHELQFADEPKRVYLKAATAAADNLLLPRQYGLPALSRIAAP
jgi:S1-C subfamily serine protease